MTRVLLTLALSHLLLAGTASAADFKKFFEKMEVPSLPGTGAEGAPGMSSLLGGLSQGEISQGLKEALSQGVRKAIASLGQPDGFLGNPQVKIPMPGALSKVESALRTFGQDKYADEFVETMNHAAERAVPEAASIFGDAISQMSVEDAQQILQGPDDAATQYFQRTATDGLVQRFRPIVEQATDRAGVTSAYKNVVDNAGFVGSMLGKNATDVDGYVTDKAVAGLFKLIAEEEKRIRTDPVARSTELLKKVFQ